MRKIEDDCVGCDIYCCDCGLQHAEHLYCDQCGYEDSLYRFNDEEICIDCIEKAMSGEEMKYGICGNCGEKTDIYSEYGLCQECFLESLEEVEVDD
ncbi:MAG: hypothetical protein K2L10_03065 [Ruminococcus sp.]|nr:hypothetical protein [Ruminococcus sp.]